MDDLRDKIAIALAKRRFWNYDGSKPIPEDAIYDADAILSLVAEDRRELVEAARKAALGGKVAADELMTEFISKRRAANWGAINEGLLACDAFLTALAKGGKV